MSMGNISEALNKLSESWTLLCPDISARDTKRLDFENALLRDLALIKQIAEKEGWLKATPIKSDVLGPL